MPCRALLAAGLLLSDGLVAAAPYVSLVKPIASANIFAESFPSIGIRIGNSEDQIRVLLDTGSALLWVNPAKHPHASTTTSITSTQFDITYGSGNVTGHVAADELHIGFLNQLDMTPQRDFGFADVHISHGPSELGGIMGMSLYDPTSLTYPGGWDILSPVLSPRVMGLRMQLPLSGVTASADEAVGRVDWGAPDPRYVQKGITYTNVVAGKEQAGWFVTTHGTHVNGRPTGLGQRPTLLDTGSTGVNLFPADAAQINTLLGGKPDPSSQAGQPRGWALPCDLGNQTLEFEFEGVSFNIPTHLLVNGRIPGDETFCHSWIQGTVGDTWVLGNTFLQAVYSVWDYEEKRVGFASVEPLIDTSLIVSAVLQLPHLSAMVTPSVKEPSR